MITAYSYLRCSTPKQKKGFSAARQTDGTEAFCEKHGWRLDDRLRFNDLGRSGFKAGKQLELDRFLRLIEDGTVKKGSVLVVERIDRLTRQNIDVALQLFLRIIQAGVDIATLDPETIHTRESVKNLAGLMIPLVHFAEANASSEGKSMRAKDNWKRKRERGGPLTARCPAWVELRNGQFYLIVAKAKIVAMIFQWAIDGLGARRITKDLNQKRIENIAYGTKVSCKKTWTQEYVEAILRNRQTFGEYQPYRMVDGVRTPEGDPISGYYPAAIDQKTFYAAQAARVSRFKQRGRIGEGTANLFTGLLFDARTGSTMRLCSSSAAEKKTGCIRRLASYHATNGIAPFVSWKYEHFERAFLSFVREVALADLLTKPSLADRLPALEGL